jgi:glutathione S-transferase
MNDGRAKLYVILGSHACRTGMLLLEHKRIPYRLVKLPTGLHPLAVRMLGFPGSPAPFRRAGAGPNPRLARLDRLGTVPALRLDGRRAQTNRAIARFLDQRQPEPPLFPADAEQRREVEEAERWGDDEFQMVARRLALAAGMRGRDGLINAGGEGRLGPLLWRHDRLRLTAGRSVARLFNVDEQAEQELLADLPRMLDRIDAWVSAGVLNGQRLNAADYMIVTSIALLTYRADLRAQIESRPAGALADRVLPDPLASRDGRRVAADAELVG